MEMSAYKHLTYNIEFTYMELAILYTLPIIVTRLIVLNIQS